ncbi:MAG: hypothetical protein WCT50_04145 [Patescibacteria group bacterium]|jgi:hypothetical protein
MKKIFFLFLFVPFVAFTQEPYDYLAIVTDHGQELARIKSKPDTYKANFLERNLIKTVSYQQFLEAEPSITRPEGYFLVMELENFRQSSDTTRYFGLLGKEDKESIVKLANDLSCCLFNEELSSLKRDKFIMLWISLSRMIVKNNNQDKKIDWKKQSEEIALIGELVWSFLPKSWEVEDIRVFSLRDYNISANLLIDAGGNIMTKIILFPELQYERKNFSYNLVEKSSKDLKHFGISK